jgi:hypothetical protein
MRAFIQTAIVLVSLLVWAAGCRHHPPPPTAKQADPPWAGFGEPGPDKITVEVSGDVRHPGTYYLPVGADLCSVYKAFGGWGGHSDFQVAPHHVRLSRENGGKRTETKYEIRKMTEEEKQAVILKDGDRLYYPMLVF